MKHATVRFSRVAAEIVFDWSGCSAWIRAGCWIRRWTASLRRASCTDPPGCFSLTRVISPGLVEASSTKPGEIHSIRPIRRMTDSHNPSARNRGKITVSHRPGELHTRMRELISEAINCGVSEQADLWEVSLKDLGTVGDRVMPISVFPGGSTPIVGRA